MNTFKKLMLALIGVGMLAELFPVYSQDDEDIIKLLTREVEVENPVYMPTVGVGTGYFNFYGDVKDSYRSLTAGKPGIRVNVATFLGKKHYFKGNLVFMTGELAGTQRSVTDTSFYKNLNFKSNIFSFGVNFHYSFKPWLKGKHFEPFVSFGVETIQFDSKADYYDANDQKNRYNYWADGTIRDAPENVNPNAGFLPRDYEYETNLRSVDRSGLGKYGQFTVAIPVDIGIDFNISERVTLRAATSLHYTLTDLIDDLSSKSKNIDYKGKSGNDMFTFSYLSLHLDLFSSDKVKTVEDLFANVDIDMSLYEDEDNDGVFDGWDQCPNTPEGVPVDTIGCPFDTDSDGIADYLDREVSRPGAIVDEYGVEINENMVVELLDMKAIHRSEVELYLLMQKAQSGTRRSESLPMPDKFKKVDIDEDNYISFDELLKTINDYFDDSSGYSPDDIKELNNFFFEQ